LLCIFVAPPTSPIRLVHYSYVFVPCLAFGIHAAGDLNQKVSFVARVLSTSFARALIGRIFQNPSFPVQFKYFLKHNSYQIECFSQAMDLHRTLDLHSNPIDCFHSRI